MTKKDAVDINNLDEFNEFAIITNKGYSFEGKEVSLKENLDLSRTCYKVDGTSEKDISWEPIGNSSNPFKGTFEGNSKTITGLYINSTNANQGIFGVVQNGNIRNIVITGNVKSTEGNVGALVGTISGTRLENITVNNSSVIQGGNNTGGIVGYVSDSSSINNSKNQSNVTGNTNVGGICGITNKSNTTKGINEGVINGNLYVGGIAGQQSYSSSYECANTNNITASAGRVGGITGQVSPSSDGTFVIYYCYNSGEIKGNGNDTTNFSSVGGISGTGGSIRYCYNTGEVYGALGQVGGISGNHYNRPSHKIEYCYNIGSLSGADKVGSIVGECNNATIENCYWTTSQSGLGYRGTASNCKQLTVDQMKAYTNKAFVADDEDNPLNNGYPVLYWQRGLTLMQ